MVFGPRALSPGLAGWARVSLPVGPTKATKSYRTPRKADCKKPAVIVEQREIRRTYPNPP